MTMKFDGREELEAKEAARKASKAKTQANVKPKAAHEAAKNEALALGVTFEYDGETYEVEPAQDWDIDVFEYAEQGDVIKAVRLLLGEEQWEKFRTTDDGDGGRVRVKRSLTHISELFEAAQAAQGVNPGE